MAIDNPLLVPSGSCHTNSSYLWNYMHVAKDVLHAEMMNGNSKWWLYHWYTFQAGIDVTRDFMYCGER